MSIFNQCLRQEANKLSPRLVLKSLTASNRSYTNSGIVDVLLEALAKRVYEKTYRAQYRITQPGYNEGGCNGIKPRHRLLIHSFLRINFGHNKIG